MRPFPSPPWIFLGLILAACPVAYILGLSQSKGSRSLHEEVPADFEQGGPSIPATFRYTHPIPLKRLATEWEPQRALVLSASFPAMMSANDISIFQVQLLDIARQYVDILFFSEHDDNRAYAYFLSLIQTHPDAAQIMEKTHFVDSRNLMRWARDFGPIFGFDQKDGLIAIDFVYRNLNRDLAESAQGSSETFRHFMTQQGDAMPADVAVELQDRYEIDVQLTRPPLWMDGGDFVHDGQGNVFVSHQTLIRNGGNRHALEELFRRYFGAKKLHILASLPGATVNHLDMILKFVNSDTLMIPDFHHAPSESLNPYRRELSRRVREILEKNETYLRKNFPDRRIIKVPMPPIMFMSPDEILKEAQTEFLRIMALNKGVMTGAEINSLNEPGRIALEQKMKQIMTREIGHADFSSTDGFNAVLRHYGQVALDKYFDLHSEAVTRYRSYINSLFLRNAAGDHGFVIPRFTSTDPVENQNLRAWEQEVAKAYKSAWPDANIHWINCDTMVTDMGFIHCVSITVPLAP